ncbi:MAG: TIGR04255 family protein [Longimicrobiaceae bacterium]
MPVEVFPNAPIEEAIIAVRVFRLDDLTSSAEHFHRAVIDLLPEREEITDTPIPQFSPERAPRVTAARGGPTGVRFSSPDRLQAAAITRTGFSFHRLRPYVRWEQFEEGLWPAWRAFVSYFGPESIEELRLRYLNRIVIPRTDFELADYFNTHPKLPPSLDTGMRGFLTRLSLFDLDIPAEATITLHSVEEEAQTGLYPVIFDIDVATMLPFRPTDAALMERVRSLRNYKDRLFFDSITEATRELFR